MTFNDIDKIKQAGFSGFKKLGDLFVDPSVIPDVKGVYLVLNLEKSPPVFLTKGSGGFFKGQDPNVPVSVLKEKWVKEVIVVYIGKAGTSLKSRLRQYLQFGQGKNVGHYGGRYIWQLNNSKNLVLCWKMVNTEDPGVLESDLIQQFVAKYGKFPFANLRA